MKKHIKDAAKAWAMAIFNIKKFADIYYNAVVKYEDKAVEEFKAAYPMFGPREFERFFAIGAGTLLPQFMFKSDSFVGRLLKMPDSMKWQKILVSASEDGKLVVDRGRGPEKISLDDLTKKEERALAILLNEKDASMTQEELVDRFRSLVRMVNKSGSHREPYEIVETASGKVVKVNRSCTMNAGVLRNLLEKVSGEHDNSIAVKLAEEIVECNSWRDDELDFMDEKDPSFWTDEDEKRHDHILEMIQKSRNKLTKLVREVTGRKDIEV